MGESLGNTYTYMLIGLSVATMLWLVYEIFNAPEVLDDYS